MSIMKFPSFISSPIKTSTSTFFDYFFSVLLYVYVYHLSFIFLTTVFIIYYFFSNITGTAIYFVISTRKRTGELVTVNFLMIHIINLSILIKTYGRTCRIDDNYMISITILFDRNLISPFTWFLIFD